MSVQDTLNSIEKQVNEDGFNGTLHISCEDYGIIKKALELKIPKKPIFDEDKELYVCPVCKELNAYAPDDFNDFCELCGQAIDNSLDWSDSE